MDVVTGGGPGIMQAATTGHYLGKKESVQKNKGKKNNNSHAIGLNIALPFEQHPAKHLDVYKNFDRFSGRLDTFMSLSNVVIVAPGSIGTLLELFYTWQLVQVKHICDTPIILFGSMYQGLVNWIKIYVIKNKLASTEDLKNIFVVTRQSQVIKIIDTLYQDHKEGKHLCHNFEKYRMNVE